MMAAAPTTRAPAARATSIVSCVDPPVVTTSSTTRTFSPGDNEKPRRSVSLPSCRSAKIARTPSARADFLPDDNAAERRREHDVGAERTDAVSDRGAAGFRFRWMLQNERALQIAGTVQSGGQPEVPFEQRADASKPIEHGIRSHNVIIRSYICHPSVSGFRYQVSGVVQVSASGVTRCERGSREQLSSR